MTNIYIVNGYKNRESYLSDLADQYGLELDTVKIIANTFGPSEDFDGLINALEDLNEMGEDYFG